MQEKVQVQVQVQGWIFLTKVTKVTEITKLTSHYVHHYSHLISCWYSHCPRTVCFATSPSYPRWMTHEYRSQATVYHHCLSDDFIDAFHDLT